jgi:spore germination cell wall hydrolase CwlJ-like protein
VSAFTAACDGMAERVAKDRAAAVTNAIFLNEFIFLLVFYI